MALSFGRRKPRGVGGHGGRCRHFHVHYHLPRRRASTFSLLRWLPRPSLLSCVLTPLALFFAVLAFVVSFVWFTLLYFVASLLNKDSDQGSFKNGSGDVDNHPREGVGQEGKRQAKGKAVMDHATELLTGDSAGVRKLEIKEVHIDGFSQVSRNTTRVASLNCEVRSTNNDRVVEKPSIFETGREGKHANADLEGISGIQVDGFLDEHSIRLVSRSTSGDSFPSAYSINSVQVHDLPGMNEVIDISPDFVAGSNQNMVVPSNTPSPPHSSDTKYGEEYFQDEELSDCTPYEIINFIDKHETRDQPLDEIAGLLRSSDGSAHGIITGEHTDSTEEKDAECVPESLIDCVPNLEHFDEHPVPDVPISEAKAKQSADTSDEVHDFSNEDETAALSQYSVCEDDKQVEAIGNNGVEASDPASTACDFIGNHQTATRALDDSVNGNITGVAVASRETSEDEAGDDSSSEGAPRGRPLLRRSPSQWWNLCGVVDVFAGSDD